jgi:hypothetical protein
MKFEDTILQLVQDWDEEEALSTVRRMDRQTVKAALRVWFSSDRMKAALNKRAREFEQRPGSSPRSTKPVLPAHSGNWDLQKSN